MDWASAQATAALITGVVSLITAGITAWMTYKAGKRRAALDQELADRRAAVDTKLAELSGYISAEKVRLEQRTLFQAEQIVQRLLMDARWPTRSFKQIRHHVGGFTDEELRKILVRSGALRFGPKGGALYKAEGDAETESWGLLERNKEALEK